MSDDIKILKALPVLQKISNTQTLSDYFKETVAPLREIQDNPEKKILTDAIFQQTEKGQYAAAKRSTSSMAARRSTIIFWLWKNRR